MSEIKEDLIDFGETPPAVNDLLQQGVLLTRHDRAAADARFRAALQFDPTTLASYFCLYKIHGYQGRIDDALAAAGAGLAEAARQAGLPADWTGWTREDLATDLATAAPGPVRFALYTLKAMAFLHLRGGEPDDAWRRLGKLADLGQIDDVGGRVVADLARAVAK